MTLSRRRLGGLAAVAAMSLASRPGAGEPARRVASMDYGLAETMLVLGTVPIAIPDAPGWSTWVVEPALPLEVANLGADQEINLELLASLKPDLILTTPYLDDLNPTLARIAPCERLVMYAGEGPGPLARATVAARRIGTLLGIPGRAEAYLAAAADQFATDRARLAALPSGPLLLVDFLDPRHVRAYATNSLWQDTLDRLGLRNAWDRPTTSWGFSIVGIEALADAPDDTVLVTSAPVPPDVSAVLARSALWRRLPFVQRSRMLALPSALAFGAVPSARRFAGLLTDRLLGMPPA